MSTPTFLSELKRRQIYRGGVMYVVAGWVIVQVATSVFPVFNIPDWAIRLVVVAILLGFPLALVALWMFESGSAETRGTPAAQPAQPPVERRRNSDGDAIARLVESERIERQRTNEELIAALDRIKSAPPTHAAATHAHGVTQPAPAGVASTKPRAGRIFIVLFATLLVAWILWILVAPSTPIKPSANTGELTREYVMPAYRQVEQVGAALLEPLLRKAGVRIAPERVFTALMMIIALLVLRNLYRSMRRTRRLRHSRT